MTTNKAKVVIRPRVLDDSPGVIKVCKDWDHSKDRLNNIKFVLNHHARSQRDFMNNCFYVAEKDNQIVGYLTIEGGLRFEDEHVGKLTVHVLAEYRGQGLGSDLMQVAMYWAIKQSTIKRLEVVNLLHDKNVRVWLRQWGFKVESVMVKRRFHEGEYVDAFMLVKIW